ncbi:helix-turn-helix transcriptional regulator [Pseudonocardia sp. GCM10023141]|uniref:helix-turn-helix transcriptional regulator n=1 Tax=Pseudonocardia sp. GCM10023141 TaxID=3252653 RepID=UPI00361176CC
MSTAVTALEHGVRRRELAAFLRSRRERITPEQVGLPELGRRRTPGLRREEVAQLAGVGVTWYTWLEQGRDINASEQVLDAIARTLRLDPQEIAHLYRLGGAAEPTVEKESNAVPAEVHAIMAKLDPFPAVVYNARTDILAWNRAYNALFDVDAIPADDRNAMLQCFTNAAWQAQLPDWAAGMPRSVAQFRASMADHVADPCWKSLVKRLRAESPAFEELWNRHDVQPMYNQSKRVIHSTVGELRFHCSHLWFGRRSEIRLTTFTPDDEATQVKIEQL